MVFNIFVGGVGVKVIGIDLHGTITSHGFYNPDVELPWWLFYFLPLSKPREEVVKKMQLMEGQGCQFIIVTATPDQFFRSTKRLLISHCVPFKSLDCVGFGKGTNERKLRVIEQKKIEIFVDSDHHVVEFLRKNSINAVTSLEHIP